MKRDHGKQFIRDIPYLFRRKMQEIKNKFFNFQLILMILNCQNDNKSTLVVKSYKVSFLMFLVNNVYTLKDEKKYCKIPVY